MRRVLVERAIIQAPVRARQTPRGATLIRALMRGLLPVLLAASSNAACRSARSSTQGGNPEPPDAPNGAGVEDDAGTSTAPGPDAETSGSLGIDAGRALDAGRDGGPFASRPLGPLRRTSGLPSEVGCADGTREGFIDVRGWRNIAGCAGAFDVPGLLDPASRAPQCDREAGDTGLNQLGRGCSVSDLCAEGWHVCAGPDEVGTLSPTDCESAADPDHPQFFLVRAGASEQGLCGPDPMAANDLHGCGSLGQPEAESCQPLERRLSFADCLASAGVWQCGGPEEPHREALVVTKPAPSQGGALCCRDR